MPIFSSNRISSQIRARPTFSGSYVPPLYFVFNILFMGGDKPLFIYRGIYDKKEEENA